MFRNKQKFFESLYIRLSLLLSEDAFGKATATLKYCWKSQKRYLLLSFAYLTQQWLHTGNAASMAALLAAAAAEYGKIS